jgi:ATP-dependent exoDNAse (exonuclease V) beta subunit
VRGREGVLTFDDLIIKLRDLLRDSPFAATALRERYDVLMIDEFQDTDPAQVEIALSFARHPGTADVEPGRVFLVGDPKQSIYRFRKADMSVYAQTRELISMADGKFPVLSRNRRSRQPIIDWVNATFMKLFGSGDEPNVQPPYVGIEPARTGPSMSIAGPGVAFFGNEDSNKAQDVYRKEARAIASLCHMILKEGWQVEDDGEVRRAGLRDIAILMPTRASLVSLERSLGDAQVPYRVESGSLVYRTQEVRDLINCLTAIDDPSDEVAIVGGLRSPAFACSDVDLARHRSGGGRWNYLSPDLDDRDGPVADALRVLRDYHRLRRDHSLAALVERFTSARGFAEIDVLDQDSRNSFRRMRFVAEQARRFEESAPESLRAFVSWLEHLATGTVIDQEGAGLEDDEDAARILTIHAAKGLEFPIVIMTGLAHRPSGRAEMFMADMANGDVAVAVRAQGRNESTFNFQAGPAEELREVEKRHSLAEANRLLYVAATRARDHLVISLYHSANSAKGCAAQRLIEHGAREGAVELVVPGGGELARAAPFDGLTVDPAPVALAEFDERRSALVEGARQQRYTSATALGPQVERKEHADDDTEPWARGRGGTHLGRAVHAAIQSLPLDAGDDAVRASSRAQAVAEAIPDRAAEVTRLVGRALSSAAAGRARKATRALREVPFAMSQDGVILEGFVDLVIEADGGIEIVDWKTDDVNEKEIEERLRSYELQAGLYILGLERATGRPVRAVTYVFVRPGIERSPGAPDALREQALSRLAEAAIST